MNYVYETLGKHGNDVMGNYHLLSHFQHSDLAGPIQPFHADDTIRDALVFSEAPKVLKSSPYMPVPSDGIIHSTKHNTNGHTRKRQQQLPSVAV